MISALSIVFSLGMILLEICPASYGQIKCPTNCSCYAEQRLKTVECSKENLHILPEGIDDSVGRLDLSDNNFIEISEDINRFTLLYYLNLAKNRLTFWPRRCKGLKSLQQLDLTENKIYQMDGIVSINQLSSLVVLHLSRNPLKDVQGLTSKTLQLLDASYCDIAQINNTSLKGLSSLMYLNLAWNPLWSIRKASSNHLQWLDVSNCNLNRITDDVFLGFPNLEELKITNNPKLTSNGRCSVVRHPKLKRLDVSRCNWNEANIDGCPSLVRAELSHNVIRNIRNNTFKFNQDLTQLSLNSNGIEWLNVSAFNGLSKLQFLDLSSNNLRTIHHSTFVHNVELKILNISSNSLYKFPNLTASVIMLDLSSNLIENIETNSLNGMVKLKYLNLSDNRVQILPNNLWSGTLINFNLKRNRLVDLNNESFLQLLELERIDLSGNRLTVPMNPDLFQNNLNMMKIQLDDNPWRCDCWQLYPMYIYLIEKPEKAVASSLICQSPANVSGSTWELACSETWDLRPTYTHERKWGVLLLSLVMTLVLFSTVLSIRRTMKIKRQSIEERENMERAEARERLRLLQRRNQHLEEEILEFSNEPRIHPLELIGPPSYEEAVHMPRLARSLDDLGEISTENAQTHRIGSVDSLRAKKRRPRRIRRRIQSEDDLCKREERRVERIRNNDKIRTRRISTIRVERGCVSAGSSNRANPRRPPTPSDRRKKRHIVNDEYLTDDEDSDLPIHHPIVIKELRKEPKSRYKKPHSVDEDS